MKCYKATCERVMGNITAWFCPDIPVKDGPYLFSGLPGLILKLEMQNSVITAIDYQTFNDNVLVINKPNKGKKVKRKDFDNLMAKKIKEIGSPGVMDIKVKIK